MGEAADPLLANETSHSKTLYEPGVVQWQGGYVMGLANSVGAAYVMDRTGSFETLVRTTRLVSTWTSSDGEDWKWVRYHWADCGGFQGKLYLDKYLVFVVKLRISTASRLLTLCRDGNAALLPVALGVMDLKSHAITGLFPVVVRDLPSVPNIRGHVEPDLLLEGDRLTLFLGMADHGQHTTYRIYRLDEVQAGLSLDTMLKLAIAGTTGGSRE